MTDLYHDHDSFIVVHNVENPERALPDSEAVLAREFLASRRTRIVFQSVDSVDDAGAVRFPAYTV